MLAIRAKLKGFVSESTKRVIHGLFSGRFEDRIDALFKAIAFLLCEYLHLDVAVHLASLKAHVRNGDADSKVPIKNRIDWLFF